MKRYKILTVAMKKILIWFLTVAMCVLLCACKGGSSLVTSEDASIYEVQGESISGVEDFEEQNNFIENGNLGENTSGELSADTALKEDDPQEAVTAPLDTSRCETYWISGSVVNFRETPSIDGAVLG